ncbi:molybdopterin-dependent oxidoreductase [Streptomyces sp. WAC06614]|uniref:molybdopterin-dependent oxidoreductase n=1 Tax=Streptomyces sp. WAC06614 TaxID=2487416 RepID=UPI001C8D0EFF|nr:molybdopterin-dependent oxidoreductase [Streptomyces sp. WAC06614]
MNGAARQVVPAPDATAVELLRDTMGLTGAKLVCGSGACGACTVLVDGVPRVSCLTPAVALENRSVTTVEGLHGKHPVQRAFAAHDALQCGYCTPGFVVAASEFVDRWRSEHGDTAPPRPEITAALAGNLCRCGAYPGIYAAVAAACTGAHDAQDAAAAPRVPPARVEAEEKITGAARYTTDHRPEGMLEGVIVRSRHPHARVRSVTGAGTLVDLLPADRTVRYVGQPVAALAAPTLAEALAAARQVEVEYEVLPAVVDVRHAEEPGSPLAYPSRADRRTAPTSVEGILIPARWRGNLRGPLNLSRRARVAVHRIEEARADRRGGRHLVEGTFTTAPQTHTPLEPHACLASWDSAGELHLWVSTQAVGAVAEQAAERFGLKPGQVHVTAPHVGGGFGAKLRMTGETVAAAELAAAHAAPVRVVLSRAEELTDGGHRPGTRAEIAVLVDERGDLAALTLDVHADGGTSIGSGVAAQARFLYGRAPRRLRDYDIVTNRPPAAPFRGPGGPPLAWALEQAVDEAAHRRGEDPLVLRRRWDGNAKRRALYDVAARLPLWTRRPTSPGTGRFRRGVGVAAANWVYFLDPGTRVELAVEQGLVVARSATQDIGQGSRSVMAEVVAAELGLPRELVRVDIGRSTAVHGPTSSAGRTTASVAPAARDAAVRLRAALTARAGRAAATAPLHALLAGADGLRVIGRRPRDRRGHVTPVAVDHLAVGRGFTGAVQVTEVEVDTLLGRTRVTRAWSGIAAGRIHAPVLARSQCEGGIVQGIGYALHEERITDPLTGVVLTDDLDDYRIPGIGDVPEIDVHFHEEGFEHVDGGGVGLAEVCTLPVAASIGNAVHAATGWRPYHLPIRPDRLLEGLNP